MSDIKPIDANALKKKIQGVVENEMPIDEKWALGLRYSLKLIDNSPTVSFSNLTTSDIDELCRLRFDLKTGLHVGSTLRTQTQINKFVSVLDKVIDNAPTVEINDKSLEIARKSVGLGRRVGKLEGKLERPQGEWITDNFHNTICNKCGGIRRDNRVEYIAFCNKCGAKMKGGAK